MSGVEKCMCVCVRMVFGVEKNVYVVCVWLGDFAKYRVLANSYFVN